MAVMPTPTCALGYPWRNHLPDQA